MTRNDITIEAVSDAFNSGLNINQIARLLNCSPGPVKDRLIQAGLYTKKEQHKAQHGTRTMYVHYGCRCEACCKAEHAQYLKRPEAKLRRRTYSKYGDIEHRAKPKYVWKAWRYEILGHNHIKWTDIAERFSYRCAICGCAVDPTDMWTNDAGRKCIGRKYPTVDHIVPLKYGGKDTFDNVQLACKHCNSKKGARLEVDV